MDDPTGRRRGIEDVLRARGYRVSASRRLVLMALCASAEPVTAEEIAAGVDDLPPSDPKSVYRNLEMLEQQGLVYHLHLGHGPRRYRLVDVAEPCYLVCEVCGRIDSVPSEDLDDARLAIQDGVGYVVSFRHYPVIGSCPACSGT